MTNTAIVRIMGYNSCIGDTLYQSSDPDPNTAYQIIGQICFYSVAMNRMMLVLIALAVNGAVFSSAESLRLEGEPFHLGAPITLGCDKCSAERIDGLQSGSTSFSPGSHFQRHGHRLVQAPEYDSIVGQKLDEFSGPPGQVRYDSLPKILPLRAG